MLNSYIYGTVTATQEDVIRPVIGSFHETFRVNRYRPVDPQLLAKRSNFRDIRKTHPLINCCDFTADNFRRVADRCHPMFIRSVISEIREKMSCDTCDTFSLVFDELLVLSKQW